MVGMPATVWLPVIGVLFIRLLTISAVLLAMSFRFLSMVMVCYIPAVTLHVVECRLAALDDQLAVVDVLILSSF